MVVGVFSMSNMSVYAAATNLQQCDWLGEFDKSKKTGSQAVQMHSHDLGPHTGCNMEINKNYSEIGEFGKYAGTYSSSIQENYGIVTYNYAIVNYNYKYVMYNEHIIRYNYAMPTESELGLDNSAMLDKVGIIANKGSVNWNYGYICQNTGTVSNNYGYIGFNSGTIQHQYDKFTFSLPKGYTSSVSEFYAERGGSAIEFTIEKADSSLPDYDVIFTGIDANLVKVEEGKYKLTNNDNSGTTVAKNIELSIDASKYTECESGKHYFIAEVKEGLEGQCKIKENCGVIGKYYKYCTFCNALSTEIFEVPSAGTHNLVDGVCSICGTYIADFATLDGHPNGFANEGYANLIDGKTDTKWCCDIVDGEETYVIIKASDAVEVNGYTITTAGDTATNSNRNPKAWELWACNDYNEGTKTGTWTKIHTVTEGEMPAANTTPKKFVITETGVYQYFKWNITSLVGGTTLQVSEFALSYRGVGCEKGNHVFTAALKEGLEGQCKKKETCETAGEYYEYCSRCDALSIETFEVPAIGNHDFGEQGTDEKCASCQIKNINYSGLTITAEDVDYTGTAQTATISGIESSSYDVADNIKTDAGTYTITLTGKGEYAGTRTVEWKINKANPTCVAPTGLTANYGQTLSAITLANPESNTNGAWTWTDGTQTVGNVGTNTFTAKFTPDDSTNYKTVENIEVTVTVGQADTEISVPGSFSKTYGDSSFALNATKTGDGILTYVSSDTNVVTVDASGNVTIAGAGTATVTVSMAATTNCKAATDKTVTITVEKATSISGAPGTTRSEQVKSGKKVSDIELPDGWVWSDDSKDTVLSTTAGEIQTATAIYTAADAANYTEAAKSVTVTITMSACSHPVDKVREVIDVDPTCTVAGKKHKVCDECGLEIESNITIAALGHAPGEAVKENVVDATCTTDGSYDLVVYCSVCGDKLSTTPVTVEKLGHTQAEAVKENVIAPTCTEDGSYDEVIKCSVCGEELSKTSRIDPKTGHTAQTPVKENEVAPTCTTAGSYDSVTYCHCGAELGRETIAIPTLGHKWDNGTIIKHPTATEAGKKQYKCLNDSSHTKTETIPATGVPTPSQSQKKYEEPKEDNEPISASNAGNSSVLDTAVLARDINSATAGGTVTIDRRYNRQFLSNAEMKALLKKGTVALRMQYSYNGVEYDITIPAGAAINDNIPFYGPLYLASHFRATKNVVKLNSNTVNTVTSGKAIKGVVTGKYVVNRGDSLYRIARKFGTTIGDLRQKNPQIKNINVIRPGQEINI